jgi:hypothetical protein
MSDFFPGVSEMSCGTQTSFLRSGLLIGPRRMAGEKHSRMMDVSWSDFSHAYHRHASPGLQFFCWPLDLESKSTQSGFPSPENKEPHWWQSTEMGAKNKAVTYASLWIDYVH